MIPGANILNMALSVIGSQTVVRYAFASRATNASGKFETVYAAGVVMTGCSFQPVPRNLYSQYGLDFAKSYFTWYVQADVMPVKRGTSGDQLEYFGRRYQCESDTPWQSLDGWDCVLCVDVGPAL